MAKHAQNACGAPFRSVPYGVLRMLLVQSKQIRDRDRQEGEPRKGNTEQPSIACASQFCNKGEGGEIWPRISRSAGLDLCQPVLATKAASFLKNKEEDTLCPK